MSTPASHDGGATRAMTAWLERFEWWQRTSARERILIAIGAGVVVVALAATLVVAPVAGALSRAPQARAERKALLAQAASRVDAIRAPATAAAPPLAPRAAIERALDRQGVARSAATIDTAADRIGVTLPAVRLADVAAVVASLARDGLRASAISLSARADSADLRAELAFTRTSP